MVTRRPIILGFSLLLGGLVLCGFGSWLLFSPAQYRAETRIIVDPKPSEFEEYQKEPPESGTYDPHFIQTTFEIIRSPVILSNVIEGLNLNEEWGKKYSRSGKLQTEQTVKLLRKQIGVQTIPTTMWIEISATCDDPNEAARLANAIAKSYKDNRWNVRKRLIERGIEVLQRQYQGGEEKIRMAQTNLDLLRDKYHIDKEKEAGFNNSTTFSPLPKPTTPAEREKLQKEYERTKPFWEMKRELNNLIEFHKLLAVKIEFEKSNLAGTPPVLVQVTDAALPPKSPVGPDRILGVLLFGVGGFPTVGGLLLLKSSRRQSA